MSTEAETVAHLATLAADPATIKIEAGFHGAIVHPEGSKFETVDYEKYLPAPRRAKGTTMLHDPGSLIVFTRKHGFTGPAADQGNRPDPEVAGRIGNP